MEIIASSLTAATATGLAPVAEMAMPDGLATARFAEVMAAGTAETASVANAQNTVRPDNDMSINGESPAVALDGKASLGERILNGLSGASSDFQQSLSKVSAALDASSQTSPSDLLKLQLNLTQVTIQYDLIGKVISRTTQNIDQMVKIQ